MAVDFGREMRTAINTGKVYLGTKEAEKALRKGEVKLIVVVSNPSLEVKRIIDSYPDVPVYTFKGNNFELGSTCGKPFAVSVISVVDPGNSNILKLID